MARKPTLLDRWGRPMRRTELRSEVAAATIGGVRSPITGYPGTALDPERLAGILRAADQGDAIQYLELAETVEERDPHYASVLGVRKRKVSSVVPTVTPASDDAKDVKIADDVRDHIAHHDGFADLVGRDGNQDTRYNFKVNWRKNDWSASFGGNYIGSFYQSSLTLDDGTRYIVPSMTTYDATLSYRFDVMETRTRVRFGVKNLTDERAPLADRFFGYFADAHRDYGRNYYLDLKAYF